MADQRTCCDTTTDSYHRNDCDRPTCIGCKVELQVQPSHGGNRRCRTCRDAYRRQYRLQKGA